MKFKQTFVLSILMVTGFLPRLALAVTAQIEQNCSSGYSAPANNLSGLLNSFQDKFQTVKSRTENREELVKSLDKIIYQTPFAEVLNCRDQLIRSGEINYSVNFLNPDEEDQTMSVINYDDNNDVVLNFSTKKSAQRIIHVYIHELTHVCQTAKSKNLFKLMKSAQDSQDSANFRAIEDDKIRYEYEQEIEAFLKQQKAYRFFTGKSRRFCKEESLVLLSDNSKMYESFLETEDAIKNGFFAQQIIYGYQFDKTIEDKERELSALFEVSSSFHSYPDSGETFELQSLNPTLKKNIEALGLSVID